MKTKIYQISLKIVETCKIKLPNAYIPPLTFLAWYTLFNNKIGGVKLILWTQISRVAELMRQSVLMNPGI